MLLRAGAQTDSKADLPAKFPAENDSQLKLRFSLGLENGIIINLPEVFPFQSMIRQITTANHAIGIQFNVKYEPWDISLAIVRNGYDVGMDCIDEELMSVQVPGVIYRHSTAFGGDYSVYTHIPLKIGYRFNKPSQRIQVSPFVILGMLHTWHAGMAITSEEPDTTRIPTDTLTEFLSLAMARPYQNALTYGVGIKISYELKKIFFALDIEYYQSNRIWTSIKGEYYRTSQVYGNAGERKIFGSHAKSAMAGVTIGYKFK